MSRREGRASSSREWISGLMRAPGVEDDGVVMLAKFGGGNVRADGNVAEKSQLRGGSGVAPEAFRSG